MAEARPASGWRSAVNDVEALVVLHLRNRYIWLALALSLLLIGELSWLQYKYQRFDTLTLMSHLTACIEAGILAVALISALATPALREAWYARMLPRGGRQFNYFLAAIAGNMTVMLALLILLLPVLYLHRYPELAEAAEPVRVLLMMLQRGALLLAAVLVTYHVALILRYYLRAPWALAGLLGLAWHIALGYAITYLSFSNDAFRRLNDVFYYNQLWRLADWIPKLARPEVYHNIEQPYFGYYFGALVVWGLSLLLLIPQTLQLTAKEKPVPTSPQ